MDFFAQADISDHWQKAEMLPLNYYLLSGKMENRNFTANLIHHRIGLDKRHERAMEEWWKKHYNYLKKVSIVIILRGTRWFF